LDPRGLGQVFEKRLVRATVVAPNDRAHRRVSLQRRRVHADRLALDEPGPVQYAQHPREDRLMRLQIDQPPRSRDRRVVGRQLAGRHAQKITQAERVGSPPGDPTLAVDALEEPEQQAAEVDARSQPRPSHLLRVELRAQPLDMPVEPLVRQHAIHRPIERMALRPQLLMRDEQVLLLALAFSHCHIRILPNPRSGVDLDQVFRSLLGGTSTTGCYPRLYGAFALWGWL